MINFLLDLFKDPAIRLAYQLGLSEENSFFGLETLLAVAGLVIGVVLLTALGYFSKYLLGRVFINLTERILDKVPFINAVYRSVKQIVETFGKENRAVFKEVCLIEYPLKIATPLVLSLPTHQPMFLTKLVVILLMFLCPLPPTQQVDFYFLLARRKFIGLMFP